MHEGRRCAAIAHSVARALLALLVIEAVLPACGHDGAAEPGRTGATNRGGGAGSGGGSDGGGGLGPNAGGGGLGGGGASPTGIGEIGEEGGIVSESGLTLVILPGALFEPTPIAIATLQDVGAPDEGLAFVGPVYELSPSGTTFSPPAYASVKLDPAIAADYAEIALYLSEDGLTWTMTENAAYDAASAMATGEVPHFSKLVAMGAPKGDFLTTWTTIGPAGGFLVHDDLLLTVPPGALPSKKVLWVSETLEVENPKVSGLVTPLAGPAAYRFGPNGLALSKPARVSLTVPSEVDLWGSKDGSGWEELPAPSSSGETHSADLSELGYVAPFASCFGMAGDSLGMACDESDCPDQTSLYMSGSISGFWACADQELSFFGQSSGSSTDFLCEVASGAKSATSTCTLSCEAVCSCALGSVPDGVQCKLSCLPGSEVPMDGMDGTHPKVVGLVHDWCAEIYGKLLEP